VNGSRAAFGRLFLGAHAMKLSSILPIIFGIVIGIFWATHVKRIPVANNYPSAIQMHGDK
jgi:hypothetical protein